MYLIPITRLFRFPNSNCGFYISAKLDKTFWSHLAQGLVFSYWWLYGLCYIVGHECADAYGTEACVGEGACKQGFDLLDVGAFCVGLAVGQIIIRAIPAVW